MSFGHVIQMITNLTILFGGAILAVRPCPLRWNNIPAKVMLTLGMAFLAFLTVGNTFYFKFSVIEFQITSSFSIFLLFTFFKIDFWRLTAQFFIYRLPVLLISEYLILLISLFIKCSFYTYIQDFHIPWHWLHLALCFFIILLTFSLIHTFKTGLLQFKEQKFYIYLSLLIFMISILDSLFFNPDLNPTTLRQAVQYLIFFLFVIIVFLLILIYSIKYFRLESEKKSYQTNFDLLKKQYASIQNYYIESNRKLHNMKHHYQLIINYLKNNDTTNALSYAENMVNEINFVQRKRYTGISEIDFILDYKINYAHKHHIHVELDINVLFNPLKDYEICILLGNLLDNAIEAVQNLPNTQKNIFLNIKTINNMFFVKISNPYIGPRKLSGNKYLTSKNNIHSHGFGLDSVKMIVNKYHGNFNIDDDRNNFCVTAIIFHNEKN